MPLAERHEVVHRHAHIEVVGAGLQDVATGTGRFAREDRVEPGVEEHGGKARRETVAILQTVRRDDWNRTATFAEYGEVTLGGLAHILRSHDLQHLACLHWLLAKM